MATVTYPSLTNRNTQQSRATRSQVARSQSSPYSTVVTRSQTSSSLVESPTTQNITNTQMPAGSPSHGGPQINQSGRRLNPQPRTPTKSSPIKQESPGQWKHPRAEDIAKRQKASSFGTDNVTLIIRSTAAFLAFEFVRRMM